MKNLGIDGDDALGRDDQEQNDTRGLLRFRSPRTGTAVAAGPAPDRRPGKGAIPAQNTGSNGSKPTDEVRPARPRAMVVDPDESRRAFIANVLMLFEPGFDVVTVDGLDEATEWMQTFVPNLLVMSDTLEEGAANTFVEIVLATPTSCHSKVVSVRHGNKGESAMAHRRHATLADGASLSDWLGTVSNMHLW